MAAVAFCADMEGQGEVSGCSGQVAPPLMTCAAAERLAACTGVELPLQLLVGSGSFGLSLQLPMPSAEVPAGNSCSSEGSAEAACCPDDRMDENTSSMLEVMPAMLGATMQQ